MRSAAVHVVAVGRRRHLGDGDQRLGQRRLALAWWRSSCGSRRRSSGPPLYGLEHQMAVGTKAFLESVAGATGAPFVDGNRVTVLNNGDEFYPAMLDAIRHARRSVTIEAYIYWNGEVGREFARALADRCAARRAGEDPARCRRLGHHRHGDPEDPRRGRLPAGLVPPDSLVHDRPLQPAHAPQDAARGRTRGIHRRRRHRRPVERSRAGSRTTGTTCRCASRARASCRCRPGSSPTGWKRPASWSPARTSSRRRAPLARRRCRR